jgi:hypothetical protein
MRMRRSGLGLLIGLLVCVTATAAPPVVNQQGFLTDASGTPLNGTASLVFRIFAAASGGSALWTETHASVPVVDGVYQVQLGSITSFPATLFDGSNRWLEVTANGELMSPRQFVASVPYALNAPIAGVAALAGTPCNPANPAAGTLVVTYAPNGAVTLACSQTYTLSVSIVGGIGGGAGQSPPVTSSPPGISCQPIAPTDCSETYVGGTSVTLTATSNAVFTFTGWSCACTGLGPCVLSMTTNRAVTANFSIL